LKISQESVKLNSVETKKGMGGFNWVGPKGLGLSGRGSTFPGGREGI